MSRAKALTLGDRRGTRGPRTVPVIDDGVMLRRLAAAARPDLETFRTVLDRLAARHPEVVESATYAAAADRYAELADQALSFPGYGN